MIVTERTPNILIKLMNIYKEQNMEGKAYLTLRDVVFHNNSPVNVVKAVNSLNDVKCMIRLGSCHPVELEYCLRYLSEVSGYKVGELLEKVSA
jgi:hypothetical protein